MESYLSNIDTYLQQQQQQQEAAENSNFHQQTWSAQPDSFTSFLQQPHFPSAAAYPTPTSGLGPGQGQGQGPAPASAPVPALDSNGQPIKIRKKPGRKPNPASPALRKAQNRAAQRAFRERKERHLRDLENTIRTLRELRQANLKQHRQTKKELDATKAENWYLKGVVLTLQFICLHNNIKIPTHSPYLTEEALEDIAKTAPHAIEAYVNAYTHNNQQLKPTMASHFANTIHDEDEDEDEGHDVLENPMSHDSNQYANDDSETTTGENQYDQPTDNRSMSARAASEEATNIACRMASPSAWSNTSEADDNHRREPSMSTDYSSVKLEQLEDQVNWQDRSIQNDNDDDNHNHNNSNNPFQPHPSSLSAIQRIRLQLRVQSSLTAIGNSAARLQPTILQLAIPHDPRIDLLPTPHMRDRMIIFRDIMDYDRCFAMLLNGAVHHGGDPTMSESWELPPEFFSEFWYLCINYDIKVTNNWRRVKGLPDIAAGPKEDEIMDMGLSMANTQGGGIGSGGWSDQMMAQMTSEMPSLLPVGNIPQSYARYVQPQHQQQQQQQQQQFEIFDQLMQSPSANMGSMSGNR